MSSHGFANVEDILFFTLARRCLCTMGLRDEAWPPSSAVD
jgi:hypothetical protein